jgi:NAD(P) transhydrogenase subunit alpha
MFVGVPKEQRPGETRVAATPDSVKKLLRRGLAVRVERGAGSLAHYPDEAFRAAGAELVDRATALGSDIVFQIRKPEAADIAAMKRGAVLASLLEPYQSDGTLEKLAAQGVSALALELVPRTSRAQSMDVLSSQAGIAGYRAVLEAAARYGRFFPMMMTSAGSSKPCRLAVLGVGVAGLQAIATARKLGAVVEAYDVRPEVKEQILSLGAKFIDIDVGESGSGAGGYARELSEEAKRRQQAALMEKIKAFDVVITTANVPGRKAPTLVAEEAVRGMRPGSVIVDMAAPSGGNCPLTEPDRTVVKHGVTIVGTTNFPALVPTDASAYFAQNLVNLLDLFWVESPDTKGARSLKLSTDDDIIAASLVTHQGAVCLRP